MCRRRKQTALPLLLLYYVPALDHCRSVHTAVASNVRRICMELSVTRILNNLMCYQILAQRLEATNLWCTYALKWACSSGFFQPATE